MGFGQAVKSVVGNYVGFSGRASRSEFWWFYLFVVIVNIVLNTIDNLTGLTFGSSTFTLNDVIYDAPGVGILSTIFSLAIFLPFLAVGMRRLHDSGRTGWWMLWGYLLTFACCIGLIILIVFWVSKSEPADNKYGPPPSA